MHYRIIGPSISEETFEYLPIVTQVTSYNFCEASCFGFFYVAINFAIGFVNIPEHITINIDIIDRSKPSLLSHPSKLDVIHLDPGNKHIEYVSGFKLPGGWYNRDYEVIASIQGITTVRSLLKFTLDTNAQITYRKSNYLRYLRSLLNNREINTWETSLCLHLDEPIEHGNILDRSGIHNLMLLYYLNFSKDNKKQLYKVLQYIMNIIGSNYEENEMLMVCHRNTNARHSSNHIVYDIIKEMEEPLIHGKMAIESFVTILTELAALRI